MERSKSGLSELKRRSGRNRYLHGWFRAEAERAGGRASEVSQGVSPSARGTRALVDGRGERASLLRALSPSH